MQSLLYQDAKEPCECCGKAYAPPNLRVHSPEPWSDRVFLVCSPACAEKVLMHYVGTLWMSIKEAIEDPEQMEWTEI